MSARGYGEVYVYRCRKPWLAILFKRHTAYVGQTRAPGMRHMEHMTGAGRFGIKEPARWSDLAPKRYVVFRSADVAQWRLDLMERLFIWALWPVYNHMHNTANPRRITRSKALVMRTNRDRGISPNWSPRPVHIALPVVALLAVLAVFR